MSPAKYDFPRRPAIEREIERLKHPTGMQLNNGKDHNITLPAGTLEHLLHIIDTLAEKAWMYDEVSK